MLPGLAISLGLVLPEVVERESGKGLGGSLGRTCEQVKVLHQGAEPTAGEIARAEGKVTYGKVACG